MSAMDHRRSDDICIWCHEPWPCATAKIRHELAEEIREHIADVPSLKGGAAWRRGYEGGLMQAVLMIDPEEGK